MKRLYSLLLLTALAVAAFAQAKTPKRLVLIEEFTNTGCGPCASWSPILDSCIHYRLGDCIAIKYHSQYPNKDDEFYHAAKEACDARIAFYEVNAFPTTLIDAQELDARSFAYLDNAITYCQQQPAKCALNISGISIRKDSEGAQMGVTVQITPHSSLLTPNSNVRLFVCLIEEHIRASKPYPNGESELFCTLRQMLSPVSGMQLEDGVTEYTVTDYINLEAFSGIMPDDLGIVVFVQDMDTKEIWNAAYHGPEAQGENMLVAQALFGTPDLICTPDYYGHVVLRNDGANTITEATLNVKVNGTVKQYGWNGSLGYLERDTMAFEGFTDFELASFDSQTSNLNSVEVWFSDINDSQATSNTLTSSFKNSVQATYGVQLKLYTDKKPEETTWKLFRSDGRVMAQGGPYTEARKFITEDFDLRRDDCYTLEFYDAGGDGISSATYGKGYYQLFQKDEAGKTKRIAQGDYDGSIFDLQFRLDGTPEASRRLVLFEEFTNTSCDPCADFSPALDDVIYRRLGDMVAITYHYNFPSPQDPFYLASANDVMTRASLYGVTGVPALQVNGVHVGAWGYEEYLDAYIDGAGEEAELVKVEATANVQRSEALPTNLQRSEALPTNPQRSEALPTNYNLHVTLSNLKSQSSNLKLFSALVEERVEWNKPAANGERAWNYVLRKLLPDADGQAIDATQVTPHEYDFTFTPDNFTDPTELGIVTFVQDMDTKEILGTCYTPRPTGSTSAAKILKVLNTPDRICTPLFTSDLMVRNTGRDALTSATLNVSINGTLQQTPWTGHLEYLDVDTLHTPAFTDFALNNQTSNLNAQTSNQNDVEIWLSDLNGTQEESVHKAFTLANAYHAENAVRLTVLTDNAPEEITWQVLNSAGDIVCEGGPYTEARKRQVADLPLHFDDCYTLRFLDKGGNGINGDNGRGYFMLHEVSAAGKTRLLVQDTYTTASHEVFFSLSNAARLKGDVNGDGTVDVADIASVITVMAGSVGGGSAAGTRADVNADGTVDVADIAAIITIMATL